MNDRRSAQGNVVPLRPSHEDVPPVLGHGTGREFVARIDLAKAQNRLLGMVVAAASTSQEVGEAVDRYEVLDAEWNANAVPDVSAIPPGACQMHEVVGVISMFDVSAGFGFIVPDNGLPEATIHGTTLRRSGFSAAPLGARVRCQIMEMPNALRVHRVYSVDVSTATPPSQLPRDEPYPAEAESDWELATVMRFDYVRGFGYLASQAQDVMLYCQIETLRRFGFFEVRPGQPVQVRWGKTARGPTVAEMRFSEDGLL